MLSRRLLSISGESNWYDGAVAAWQPVGAASLAASLLDLTGNGRDATQVGGAWDSVGGWTDGIFDSGVIPDASTTFIFRVANMRTSVGGFPYQIPMGQFTAGAANQILTGAFNTIRYQYGGNNVANIGLPILATGVFTLAADTLYINGIQVSSISSTYGTALNTIKMRLQLVSGEQFLAGGIWDTKLDAATVATISAQMAAL